MAWRVVAGYAPDMTHEDPAHELHTAESDVTYQPREGVTVFSVRRIQHDAWIAGHDAACPASLHPCGLHPSPFSDDAYCVTSPDEKQGDDR